MSAPAVLPESSDGGAPEADGSAGFAPDGTPLVPQAHGGALRRGGAQGNRGPAFTAYAAIRRKARRHLAELEELAYKLAHEGLSPTPAKEGEDPKHYAARLAATAKSGLEALRIIATIAGPSAAEDRAPDPDAAAPPTIRVLAAPEHPNPEPPTRDSGTRGPTSEPNLPPFVRHAVHGEKGPMRGVEGGKGPIEGSGW